MRKACVNHWNENNEMVEVRRRSTLVKTSSDILDEPLDFLKKMEALENEGRVPQTYQPSLFEWSQLFSDSSPAYLICLLESIFEKNELLEFTIAQGTTYEGTISSRKEAEKSSSYDENMQIRVRILKVE